MDFDYEIKPQRRKEKSNLISIMPLKDHVIKQNGFYYNIKKDEMIDVDKKFLEVLQTEKVINKG
jgi:hypothetical protein